MDGQLTSWMRLGLIHCAQVTALMLVIWLAVRVFARRRPHLACVLWLLVLIKCVTPPVWSSPASIFSWMQSPTVVSTAATNQATNSSSPGPAHVTVRLSADSRDAALRSVSKGTLAAEESEALTDATSLNRPHNLVWWCLFAWLAGGILYFALVTLRWWHCWRGIRSAGKLHSPELIELLERLRQQLGLRRSVRLLVTRSLIGPAVVGLFRPLIILPAVIVESKSIAEIEPLLAHELIHIRRGDLWLGLLQTVAQGWWWFHPLIRIASRSVNRESERCCDEQVIAHLGYSPGYYARTLLDVLSLKRTLQAVPTFPGVRPVDVTSQRLERIMKLGQGCHKRTPRWCWLVLLLAGAVTLPGAALIGGDDPVAPQSTDLIGDSYRKPEPQPPARDAQQPAPQRMKGEFQETRVYDMTDLIQRYQRDTGESDGAARDAIVSLLKAPSSTIMPSEINGRTTSAAPDIKWWEDRALIIKDYVPGHERIQNELARMRKFGFETLLVETLVISGPAANPANLPADWKILPDAHTRDRVSGPDLNHTTPRDAADHGSGNDGVHGSVESIVRKHRPSIAAVIRQTQLDEFLKQAQADARSNVMYAPRISLFNGSTANVTTQTQRPFIVGFQPYTGKTPEDAPDPIRRQLARQGVEPVVKTLSEGWAMHVLPHILDTGLVNVRVKFIFSEITKVGTAELPGSTTELRRIVQVPELSTTNLNATVELKTDQSLIISGTHVRSSARNSDHSHWLPSSILGVRLKSESGPSSEVEPLLLAVRVKQVQRSGQQQPEPQPEVIPPSAITQVSAEAGPSKPGLAPVPPAQAPVPADKTVTADPDVLQTRVYAVADLVINLPESVVAVELSESSKTRKTPDAPPAPKPDFSTLEDLIHTTIEPDSWDLHGGSGSMKPFELSLSLVIRQTPAIHEQIAGLLTQIRSLQDLQVSLHIEHLDIIQGDLERWMKNNAGQNDENIGKAWPPLIMINRKQREDLKKLTEATFKSGPKVTLFNGQQVDLLTGDKDSPTQDRLSSLQLSVVTNPDLRFVRITAGASPKSDGPGGARRSAAASVLTDHSLLIGMEDDDWTGRRVTEGRLFPGDDRIYRATKVVAATATRHFFLITPRVIIMREEQEVKPPVKSAKP